MPTSEARGLPPSVSIQRLPYDRAKSEDEEMSLSFDRTIVHPVGARTRNHVPTMFPTTFLQTFIATAHHMAEI